MENCMENCMELLHWADHTAQLCTASGHGQRQCSCRNLLSRMRLRTSLRWKIHQHVQAPRNLFERIQSVCVCIYIYDYIIYIYINYYNILYAIEYIVTVPSALKTFSCFQAPAQGLVRHHRQDLCCKLRKPHALVIDMPRWSSKVCKG